MADKIKKVNDKLEIEFKESISNINTNNVEAMATTFATWLNLYFEIWSPNNNTWIDSNKHAYTTDELWEEFKKEVVQPERVSEEDTDDDYEGLNGDNTSYFNNTQ